MASEYKPAGYTSVAPYLIVDGAERTIDFLVRTFDAAELRRFPGSGGKIMHAEVRIDDTVVMLAEAGPKLGRSWAELADSRLPRSRVCG